MIRIRPPADDGGRERLTEILNAHAEAAGFPFSSEPVALEAWDGETFLGGITAKFGAEWVFVELLAVADAARGRGVGADLMRAVEAQAREAGKTGIWLDTFAFQAPSFYERLGYTQFGRIEDYPKGSTRLFYAKRLTAEEPS